MATRRKAREVVAQLLFKDDFNPDQRSLESEFIRTRLQNNVALIRFATDLLEGIRKHQQTLDQSIEAALENWSLNRVSATDRSILRLGTYEIKMTDTPPAVVVNEAIELARRFADRQSHRFVNGVLDRIVRSQRESSDPENTESSTDEN